MQIYGVLCGVNGVGGERWVMGALMGSGVVLGGGLAVGLRCYFFMVTTSFLGSFLVFRGFGNLFGNYPNVMALRSNEKMNNSYYMYVGLILTHTLLGFLAQSI